MRMTAGCRAAAFVALIGAAPAIGQEKAAHTVEQQQALVVFMAQTFDGSQTRSISQKAGVAQADRGTDRWMTADFGEGSIVAQRGSKVAAARFDNKSATELAFAYDSATRVLSGDGYLARFYNDLARPLVARSLAGDTARWTVRFSPSGIGIGGVAGGSIALTVVRRPVTVTGRSLLLTDYTVPAFSYAEGAQTIVQWARGGTLSDATTGAVLWHGSVHRSVAQTGSADGRPYRYTLTAVTVDADGKPVLDVKALPEAAGLISELYGRDAVAPLPVVAESAPPASQTPLQLAALLDLTARVAGQGDIGVHEVALGGFLLGRTGVNTVGELPPTLRESAE